MSLLKHPDLLLARSVAAEALDGTAVYGSGAWVSDGGGGGTTTFVAAGTVACRMAPIVTRNGAEEVMGGRIQPEPRVTFTFPAETPITSNTQIIYSGGTFNVIGILERSVGVTQRVEARGIE